MVKPNTNYRPSHAYPKTDVQPNTNGGFSTGVDYPLGYSNHSYTIFYPTKQTDYTIMQSEEVVDPIIHTTYKPSNENYNI